MDEHGGSREKVKMCGRTWRKSGKEKMERMEKENFNSRTDLKFDACRKGIQKI